jgi:hypothetical protein
MSAEAKRIEALVNKAARRERQEREGVSRRGYEDRTNEGIRMGRLLVTQTWTD